MSVSRANPTVPVPTAPGSASRAGATWPVLVAVAATLLLAACTLLTTDVGLRRVGESVERQLQVAGLTADVRYLDEVLTMAANMAAATAEPRWQARYDAHVADLDAAIATLRAMSPEVFDRELGADTDAANRRLVALETRAFELVAAGRAADAKAVLDGADYAADKAIYAHGNHRAQQALAALIADERERARWLSAACFLATAVLTIVATGAWWSVLRRAREVRTAADLATARAREAAAEAASRAKSRFVADISHELRTPMTAILGYAELLADASYPDGLRHDACATIVRNGRHLIEVVNDLLDMSKIEAGAVVVSLAAAEPALVVEDVVSLMRVRARDKGLALEREFATAIPRRLHTDPLRLRQILVNLVGNAIKFTNAGRVRLRVAHDPAAGRLAFAVEDSGVGMDAAKVARLFAAFAQVDDSAEQRFQGTGLGLAISRRFAELLGGGIDVRSEPGVGSVFTLWLPAVVRAEDLWRPDDGAAPAPASRPKIAVDLASLHGRRILLAEDGPDNQRLVSWHLARAGAEVVVANNGREALERAAERPFDLVLMDMQMPEVDGYRATQVLRERGFAPPIVALTANAMLADRERCLRAGCTEYLTKPVDRAQLLATCARLTTAAPAFASPPPSPASPPSPQAPERAPAP